jgi:apolipoprotein N-acyltransferase
MLLALSLPPFGAGWLGWLALAPLLVAARGRRPLEGVGLGLLAGGACGAIHRFIAVPFLMLAVLLGMVAAVAGAARGRCTGTRWVLVVTCAALSAEWLTTFSPLPLNLALTQYRALPMIQVASVAGIWGVSFLVWWTNAALADWALQRQRTTAPLWIAVGLLAAAWIFGCWRLAHEGVARARAKSNHRLLRVAAIQDYTPDDTARLVHQGPPPEEPLDREGLTRQAVKQGAKLVVWSEMCLGSAFQPERSDDETAALARELGAHLVVGYTEAGQPKGANCAALLGPDGKVRGIHRKIHLFLGERRDTRPGRTATAFPSALGKVGMEICFDSCYTGVTRQVAGAGAQLIAMPNYDPPTPHGSLHYLHATMLPFRAVENHVPFVRADATGLSQIVDRTGSIVGQSGLYVPDALVGEVLPGDGRGTLFTRLGDWLAYLCLLVTGMLVFPRFRKETGKAISSP